MVIITTLGGLILNILRGIVLLALFGSLMVGIFAEINLLIYISMGGILIYLILKNMGIYDDNDFEGNDQDHSGHDSIDSFSIGDGDSGGD